MGTFSSVAFDGHTHVLHGADLHSGLRAIIAVHSTALGPALGGTRFYPYGSEEEALMDVLRLSRGMTYKNALAGLDHGGGKAVIIGDPRSDKSELLFRAFGQFVDSLAGLYITAEDVGTTTEDMETVARETRWVAGQSAANGGSGDPSPATALGLFHAARAVTRHTFGTSDLAGFRVAIQGVGKVGFAYASLLQEAGAEIIVADAWEPNATRAAEELGAKIVDPSEILTTNCDILSPCAMGGSFTKETIPLLQCRTIVGSANNQLETDRDASLLQELDIVYAPDFVVNAGGVINVADELHHYRPERARAKIEGIYDTILAILETSTENNITPNDAAMNLAKKRIEMVGGLHRPFRRTP